MKPIITITEDGSTSLYLEEIDEIYHSIHGAIQESSHVFIEGALKTFPKTSLSILEIGMGTGLNILLTYIYAMQHKINIKYVALEKYPLPEEIVSQLNYMDILGQQYKSTFNAIHNADWEKTVPLSNGFTLLKKQLDVTKYHPDFQYDIIFYDAFAPDKQPELWEPEIFKRLFFNLNQPGILTTYTAKGLVKRRLQKAGFQVKLEPGPPGKRHMLKAMK